MDSAKDTSRYEFFTRVYGKTEGFCCIAWQEPIGGSFQQKFFHFPKNLEDMLQHINTIERGHNVWFCPHLFDKPERKKDAVGECNCVWSDLDECNPVDIKPTPPIVIRSSENRYQALWPTDTLMPPAVAEDYSRRVAYAFRESGADQSGWDLTQLLRVPHTFNYKYRLNGNVPQVELLTTSMTPVPIGLFEILPKVSTASAAIRDLPKDLPDPEKTKAKFIRRFTDETVALMDLEPAPGADWSKLLWKLFQQLFEVGMTAEEVFVVAQDAKCNKWARDNKPVTFYWHDILRAENYHLYNATTFSPRPPTLIPRLTEDSEPRTDVGFIKEYVEYAKTKTDAAVQYHEATAFIVLSSLLSGSLHIELEHDTVKPNLWIMLIADTTLTRKTTAMEMGMRLLKSVTGSDKDDVILATDGSVEGIFSAMQGRSGRPSVFMKDEFTGLMEAMVKKDYMAGMMELLTKLYDGNEQKRVLKKETVHIREPILVLFAGGIKNKLFSILTDEHVSSGFLPRFIIISADSDIENRMPMRRRSSEGEAEYQAIQAELMRLKDIYATPSFIKLPGTDTPAEVYPKFRVDFEDEALQRLDKIEHALIQAGVVSEQPDTYVAMFDRLAKHCMKMSALVAATRQEPVEDTIWISEADVVTAASYIEKWGEYTTETLRNLGKSLSERLMDRVFKYVQRHPTGVQRSTIMNNMHLSADDMGKAVTTLEMQGRITTSKKGKALWLFPATT